MKKLNSIVVIIFLPVILSFSRETGDLKKSFINAEIIGTGVIESVKKHNDKCTSTLIAEVKVLNILKGSIKNKPLLIRLTEHYWNEDCPSVEYKLPPIEVKIEKDRKIVFGAGHFKGYDECYVISAAEYDRLDEIKKITGIR